MPDIVEHISMENVLAVDQNGHAPVSQLAVDDLFANTASDLRGSVVGPFRCSAASPQLESQQLLTISAAEAVSLSSVSGKISLVDEDTLRKRLVKRRIRKRKSAKLKPIRSFSCSDLRTINI